MKEVFIFIRALFDSLEEKLNRACAVTFCAIGISMVTFVMPALKLPRDDASIVGDFSRIDTACGNEKGYVRWVVCDVFFEKVI